MSDLIDRQAAILAMRKRWREDVESYGADIVDCFDAATAEEILNKLQGVRPLEALSDESAILEALNIIASNLFLIREAVECLQPHPPEDDGEDEDETPWAGMTFFERDEKCATCANGLGHAWSFPCNDCKHVTARKQADRYTQKKEE